VLPLPPQTSVTGRLLPTTSGSDCQVKCELVQISCSCDLRRTRLPGQIRFTAAQPISIGFGSCRSLELARYDIVVFGDYVQVV
jgi:hypothetical protein